MIDKVRTSIGLLYTRWHFRKDHDDQQQLTDFFRRAKSVLVVLPYSYDNAVVAQNTLKKISGFHKNSHFTIVTIGRRAASVTNGRRSEVIRLDADQVKAFFLPRKRVLQRVCARPYDVAVDLNLDFVLHAAYICKASRAPVRVCMTRHHAELFFNVQVSLDRTATPHLIYERFARCLGMF